MRIFSILGFAVIAAACAKSEEPPAADTGMSMPTVEAPLAVNPITLAAVAGKWNVRVMGETSDSTLTSYVLTSTADTTGWSFAFDNGRAIPMRVMSVSGDSIVTSAGPFASQLRRGTQVSTVGMFRLMGDKLMGTTTARYSTTGADSVVQLRIEGTKAQ